MPDERISTELRRKVVEQAAGCCEYCHSQAQFAMQSFSVEHIVPRARGGTNTLDNLALACQGCNNHKYLKTEDRDPITGMVVPLFHPRQQRWNDHFVWSEDYTLIIGITPIGRATVEALRLNRPGLVNLRRVLYAMGEHPPHVRS
ncbi:HNH endonuclease [Kallotenue papyrolyticum]|uniref:HNH endonuclease n=1 Tax=Kallotenue papyrolyticum TaxID=1325125 RepID=UPI0004786610|nr:HNH endonuclease [Kallotenue papyrolyticum]